MGSVNLREVMGHALTTIHWSLIPCGHLPLPALTRDAGTITPLRPKAISSLVRVFLKARVAIWHESVASGPSPAKGIALGLGGEVLVTCVLGVGILSMDVGWGGHTQPRWMGWRHQLLQAGSLALPRHMSLK